MADGVKRRRTSTRCSATKDGADRAFKKLDELKPNIQWWEAGAQPPQFLVAGDVVMTTAYNGRIDAAQREGKNLKIAWTGGIYDLDYWAIPKGTPNKDAALKFIAFASTPDAQAEYAKNIAYGPTNKEALGQARREDAGQHADLAGEREGRAAVQHEVLGRPGRRAREALRLVGGAVDVADREPAIAGACWLSDRPMSAWPQPLPASPTARAAALAGARRARRKLRGVRADAAAAGLPAADLSGADRRAAQARDRESRSRATRCRARRGAGRMGPRRRPPPDAPTPRSSPISARARQRRRRRPRAPPELARCRVRARWSWTTYRALPLRRRGHARRAAKARADRPRRALGRHQVLAGDRQERARAGPPTTCSPRSTCGGTRKATSSASAPDQRVFGRDPRAHVRDQR